MSSLLRVFTRQDLDQILNKRSGEIKLGEQLLLSEHEDWKTTISATTASFVLIGIPEDIGVRANAGVGGAHTAWMPAVQALVNIQSTRFFTGSELLLLGELDCSAWLQEAVSADLTGLRKLVSALDEEVYRLIEFVVLQGKIPIVIGGGHNNAYGLLKGASLAHKHAVNCINLDAHSDYRIREGRHSGNGFRYAKAEGYLDRYAVIGLHENYNSAAVLADMDADPDVRYSFFEDIFLRGHTSYEQELEQAVLHTRDFYTGIELDLDAIQNVLSSAATPVGISCLQARQYLCYCAKHARPCYLHLTEGATLLANGRQDPATGKLIAYFISDFIKGMNK